MSIMPPGSESNNDPDRCPRCGYFYGQTRRLPDRLEAATSAAALSFHALQVHHQTIAELREVGVR